MASSRPAAIRPPSPSTRNTPTQSPLITYELVDPNRHPELAERYKVTAMNTTHIQYGGDKSGPGTNVTDLTEEAITNGIVKLTKTVRPRRFASRPARARPIPTTPITRNGMGAFQGIAARRKLQSR